MKNNILKIIFLCLFILGGSSAIAAEFGLSIESATDKVMLGQPLEIRLLLSNPSQYKFNAISTTVVVPKAYFSVEEFWFGDSFVPLWLAEPKVNDTGSTEVITFEGLIPGGHNESGEVVRLVLRATDTLGSTSIRLIDSNLFLHNKNATEISVPTDYQFVSVLPLGADLPQVLSVTEDRVPPDNFFPIVAKNEEMFAGDYFLIFQTIDRQSGIDRYELLESRQFYSEEELVSNLKLSWRQAENPERLIDQELESYLYIRAVDRHGNQRTIIIPPTVFSGTSEGSFIIKFGMLIVVLLLFAFISVRLRSIGIRKHEESID